MEGGHELEGKKVERKIREARQGRQAGRLEGTSDKSLLATCAHPPKRMKIHCKKNR